MRAIVKPPSIDTNTAKAILDGVGLRLRSKPSNLAMGWRSQMVVVNSDLGRKVVKRYERHWPQESIQAEHSIIDELNRKNFAAVRLHPRHDRSTAVPFEENTYAVFDHVEGRNLASCVIPISHRFRLLEWVGAVLAGFHHALVDFVPPTNHHLDQGETGEWYVDGLDRLVALSDDPRLAELRERTPEIRRRLERTTDLLDGLDLPTSIIHGDFGLHNLLLTKDRTLIVHDFELARRDRQVVDLVVTMSRLRPDLAEAVLSGYESVRSLTKDERDSFPTLQENYLLKGAVRSWDNYLRLGGDHRLETALQRCRKSDSIARKSMST